ncbi:YggS family pyridoxal phosphate-dependent enzyme [Chitinilyticum litopenaei]|uniref:YggS family pyridoxal phosphate-dependent enzyme n=1 Tax=Chitinilyticum litopenaei TaxID=1121276 RepID=UPI000404AB2E|nr:YggS family pyridoxal phosphate-dependent enzyme [Chitinilyticum litopenaei]
MTTIFTAWQGVRARVAAAATRAGRPADTVELLAVSKTFPADAVRELYQHGQRHFGENYAQEMHDKALQLGGDCPDLVWHFIGPLQSNKTRQVAETASWVHSVDRVKIAERLSQQRPDHLPPLQVCIQVNVSGETSKSGATTAAAAELARQTASLPRLTLRGLMCIPDPAADAATLRHQFRQLAELRQELNSQGFGLDTLSMGMSADMELAIAEGATLVRVGTAIFGARSAKENTQ